MLNNITYKNKKEYYKSIRRSNYLASLRLEGWVVDKNEVNMPLQTREEAIAALSKL